MRYVFTVMMLMIALTSSAVVSPGKEKTEEEWGIPPVSREFRAAWVATVANIDWPSKPGLPVEQQKAELIAILDKAVELNLNALILQVRPQCDALYDSKIEPWSYYLTGKMGKAPEPYYDPLAFAVEEAHKRGIELHTWFNPYRAHLLRTNVPVSDNHISKTKPDIVKKYGSYLWCDPGEKETQDQTMNVVLDVVKRYDVDGVHLDDYFYPYKEKGPDGKILDFPDEPSWKKYKDSGGTLIRDDWRRDNVNTLVKRYYTEVKAVKPWVKVGISPFGIWRGGFPAEVAKNAFDQYSELYADAKLWLEKGWVDYWTPQIYWEISSQRTPYKPILKWWVEQNKEKRHIWPGNYTGRWSADEITSQVLATRQQPGASGNVHFSMKVFMGSRRGIADKMKKGVYREQALVPASPWLASKPFDEKPGLDVIENKDGTIVLDYYLPSRAPVWQWVLCIRKGGNWTYKILPGNRQRFMLNEEGEKTPAEVVAISAIDRFGQESPRVVHDLTKK